MQNFANNINATGLDLAIRNISTQLANLAWLDTIYGRVYPFKTDKNKVMPHFYLTNGDYVNVLPNDKLVSQCFFRVRGDEKFDFNRSTSRSKGLLKAERPLSLVFWLNLKTIEYPSKPTDYIYTERLKEDVLKMLKRCVDVENIESYIDEDTKRIFEKYDIDDVSRQFLMYPFAGFRIDFTVNYIETC